MDLSNIIINKIRFLTENGNLEKNNANLFANDSKPSILKMYRTDHIPND